MCESISTSYVKYLDATAAVKLVVKELHSETLRNYFGPRTGFVMTPFCFYETLSTLKGKWQGRKDPQGHKAEMTEAAYHDACYFFLAYVHSRKIDIEEDFILSSLGVRSETERLAKQHGLDFSDSLQLLTIKNGRYKSFADASKTLLISDDKKLVEAAREEGLSVWFLRESNSPPASR